MVVENHPNGKNHKCGYNTMKVGVGLEPPPYAVGDPYEVFEDFIDKKIIIVERCLY